jgi:ribosome-binding protein aMBF1 (putative translation factor)
MSHPEKPKLRREPRSAAYQALRQRWIAARKAAGLTQEAIAKQLNRHQLFMAKVEREQRTIDLIEFAATPKIVDLHVEEAISKVSKTL